MKKLRLVNWILLLAVAVIFLSAASCTKNRSADGVDAVALAQHLTDTGAKVYGAFWCSACKYQKDLFGDAWQYAPYVECSDTEGNQLEVCKAEKIEGYPTWVFADGSQHPGALSLQELAEISGFDSTQSAPTELPLTNE